MKSMRSGARFSPHQPKPLLSDESPWQHCLHCVTESTDIKGCKTTSTHLITFPERNPIPALARQKQTEKKRKEYFFSLYQSCRLFYFYIIYVFLYTLADFYIFSIRWCIFSCLYVFFNEKLFCLATLQSSPSTFTCTDQRVMFAVIFSRCAIHNQSTQKERLCNIYSNHRNFDVVA